MNMMAGRNQFEPRQRALRVTMLGIRGFPDVQGGAEKHVEKLSCALTTLGCEVDAIVRSCYVDKSRKNWRGIALTPLWAPRISGLEAFAHSLLGVLRAAIERPDILHIHSIGPALFTPLARALGLRVIVTHHVLNYENDKWGTLARGILRFGESVGMKFANGRIAVSVGRANEMTRTYGVSVNAIPNGIDKPRVIETTGTLAAFGLASGRYALNVARIDEQKRQLDLVAAYARLKSPSWRLALVGGADYSSGYATAVADAARQTPGFVMLGHQSGDALAELYSHAGVFVLPSSHEGQPIAVLEAASYGLSLILSDIAAHRELALPGARLIAVGDVAALAHELDAFFAAAEPQRMAARERDRMMAKHDWLNIAQQTLAVYCETLSNEGVAAVPAARIRELS
ncbi:MAG TPA: glycosyltransferase family 4 protein [Xanthobacteraceae bacterium]|nr:glycosyltransferase family 4 protein [Xanthobacteraceae bacterium]